MDPYREHCLKCLQKEDELRNLKNIYEEVLRKTGSYERHRRRRVIAIFIWLTLLGVGGMMIVFIAPWILVNYSGIGAIALAKLVIILGMVLFMCSIDNMIYWAKRKYP